MGDTATGTADERPAGEAVRGARYVQANRAFWTEVNGLYTGREAEATWRQSEITWGMFSVPESSLEVLGEVEGLDVLELGCGTAYFSAWLARRGARPVGVDVTPAQLSTARACQETFGLHFPLLEANAEQVPLEDASFDLVLSEHGACLWCDPEKWVPEAARLLRPGGRLVFLTTSSLLTLCLPDHLDSRAGSDLLRGPREIRTMRWTDEGTTEFHRSAGEWIELFGRNGLVVERAEDLYAPDGVDTHEFYDMVSADWARRWPAEELWVASKRTV